ncbi:MAG: hypothetical protein Q7K03_01485 [Dehalococcoidia bacterium]|nr:hypothetical protein [Dehalococcoidia bacterium]
MAPRTGRPATGMKPTISIRLDPEVYQQARVAAVASRKTVGQWLEEAIKENLERELKELREIATKERSDAPVYITAEKYPALMAAWDNDDDDVYNSL